MNALRIAALEQQVEEMEKRLNAILAKRLALGHKLKRLTKRQLKELADILEQGQGAHETTQQVLDRDVDMLSAHLVDEVDRVATRVLSNSSQPKGAEIKKLVSIRPPTNAEEKTTCKLRWEPPQDVSTAEQIKQVEAKLVQLGRAPGYQNLALQQPAQKETAVAPQSDDDSSSNSSSTSSSSSSSSSIDSSSGTDSD